MFSWQCKCNIAVTVNLFSSDYVKQLSGENDTISSLHNSNNLITGQLICTVRKVLLMSMDSSRRQNKYIRTADEIRTQGSQNTERSTTSFLNTSSKSIITITTTWSQYTMKQVLLV